MRDLGEIRRLQGQVRRQEKLAALGGLAAGVAHEIRNPLSSIKGLATYFAGQFDAGSEAREAAGVMVQEVDRLNRVITELLDFARPTDLKRQPTDLSALLVRSLQLVQQDAANQGVDVSLSVDPDLYPVAVDPDRLAQCLLNLYLNAIQAMEGGGTLTVRMHGRHGWPGGDIGERYGRGDRRGPDGQDFRSLLHHQEKRDRSRAGHRSQDRRGSRGPVGGGQPDGRLERGSPFGSPVDPATTENEVSMNPAKTDKILIVDDDPGHLTALKTIARSWGYTVKTADDGDAAVDCVKSEPVDLILMDVRMVRMDGIEALGRIKSYNPSIPVIVMTAYSSVESAVEALRAGAYDYLLKPLDFEVLKLTLERAREHAGLKRENKALKAKLNGGFDRVNIIGKSEAMHALMNLLAMVAPSEATVLITGESGTGKELIARSLHANSPRKDHAWVVVNCAAITETLLESELFGHEKGAFTGAEKRREGRFMQAHRGTIFLDEIGETSPTMQAKLLRALQEKEIRRVGGEQVIPVDVRIVAATNRNLEIDVAEGRFREDLFYRLNVMTVNVPPLRDRQEDIPPLAWHFTEKFAEQNRKPVKGITPLAMDMLLNHDWPGNVRELENAMERAVILMTGDHITEKQLPLNLSGKYSGAAPSTDSVAGRAGGPGSLEKVEKAAILATLHAAEGNKSEAARRLGITRKTLHNKLKSYGLG